MLHYQTLFRYTATYVNSHIDLITWNEVYFIIEEGNGNASQRAKHFWRYIL
jgi:hypothetical protein